MDHPGVHLLSSLPEWHAAHRNFSPPLVFRVPRELIDAVRSNPNDTFEALLQIDRIDGIHVDPELYSGIYIPGAEWEIRRTRMAGRGENGWYYFIFSPPRTQLHIQFTSNWARIVTFRLRCDVFYIRDGKNPECSTKCLRYVPKRLLSQCPVEIKIAPLNPFGKLRQWDLELQTPEEMEEEVRTQAGVRVDVVPRNWEIERNRHRENLWNRYHQSREGSSYRTG